MNEPSPTMKIGQKLVDLCSLGKNLEAIDTLYSQDIVSIEAMSMPDMPARMEGIDAIRGKNSWWLENHEVHSGEIKGPFPQGDDRFLCYFSFDVTNTPSGKRMQMDEVCIYTVKDGKIAQEEFCYQMGDCGCDQ